MCPNNLNKRKKKGRRKKNDPKPPPKRKQLPTTEANQTRKVTYIRHTMLQVQHL